MKLEKYHHIIDKIQTIGKRIKLKDISKLFPGESLNTLGSIYSQEYQRKMRKTHHRHYKVDIMNEYYSRYLADCAKGKRHILLTLADEIDLSPALLARMVLERHLYFTAQQGPESRNVPSRSVVTGMMRDTSLVPDATLAREIQECVLDDDMYGPIVDTIKHSIGHEYEVILEKKIKDKDLAYLGEDVLRAKGYDKTPDFKLEVPIAVGGYVVNWIESKASFGDEESHKNYLKEQFWSYWNRFGPGLVIYWFGFIEELDTHKEKGIMLLDHFPDNIVTMKPAFIEAS